MNILKEKNIKKLILMLSFTIVFIGYFNKTYSQQYSEYEVKAAYIYNFGKFVKWPKQSIKKEFIIGVYGLNPFKGILKNALEGRTLYQRPIKIIYFSNLKDIDKCNILFIPKVKKEELLRILNAVKRSPVLTIGDNIDDFCISGGNINFTPKYSKYRFYINNNSAKRKQLIISSKLLSLSKIITDEIKF